MAKQGSFAYLDLRQVDWNGTTFVEQSDFQIAPDGTWTYQYDTDPWLPPQTLTSGHLTAKELATLSTLFTKYDRAVLDSPTVGPDLTSEDYVRLMGRGINSIDDDPNMILEDGTGDAYYGSADFKAVTALNDYMITLVTKYGDGLII